MGNSKRRCPQAGLEMMMGLVQNKNRALFEQQLTLKLLLGIPLSSALLTSTTSTYIFFRQSRVGGTKEDKGIALRCCYLLLYLHIPNIP